MSRNHSHRHIDLCRNALESTPEAFMPVAVGVISVTDPISVPWKFCAKTVHIHCDLRHIHHLFIIFPVSIDLRLCDRLLRVVDRPCSEDVLPERTARICGKMTVHSIMLHIHSLHLLRKDISKNPACQTHVRAACQSDAAAPRSLLKPIQKRFSVSSFIYVRFICSLRSTCSAAALKQEHHAVLRISAVRSEDIACRKVMIRCSVHHHRPRTLSLRDIHLSHHLVTVSTIGHGVFIDIILFTGRCLSHRPLSCSGQRKKN